MNNNYLTTSEQLEQEELNRLAPYAMKNAQSQGRDFPENKDNRRLEFQRDRDRVIHSKAFRRLRGKTQVFVSHHGDHFRSRLTHSLEVAQMARSLSRGLKANEDLAECIALAHDLGHTPFGHAGEEAMNEVLQEFGHNFEHNAQSRRIVEKLEKKSPLYQGLNLTKETREGLWKHRTPYDQKNFNLSRQSFLEAQIVDLADEIAFQNHDIDDGLSGNIIQLEELEKLSLWHIASQKAPSNLSTEYYISYTISALIKVMIEDVFDETARRLTEIKAQNPDDIRHAQQKIVAFSENMQTANDELRSFLINRFYKNHLVAEQCNRGKKAIKDLFLYYQKNPHLLPPAIDPKDDFEIRIKDFVAGMTDNFAIRKLQEIKI